MATRTGLNTGLNHPMIKYTTQTEQSGVMTDTTIHGHIRMTNRLPYCISAIVTTGAVIKDIAMVHVGRNKLTGRMAGSAVAIDRRWYMVFWLAHGNCTVMARTAPTGNPTVIKMAVRIQV